MEVELRVFGLVAKSLGYRHKKLVLEDSMMISDLIREINLPISERWLMIAVNDVKQTKQYRLQDQDVITIHPICGGG